MTALNQTAGEGLTEFKCVYVKSDGKLWIADASAAATMPVISLCKAAALDPDEVGEFYKVGDQITNGAWSLTVGGLVYASTVTGGITQTPPTGVGDQVQVLGIALSATKIFFYPSFEVKEVTA